MPIIRKAPFGGSSKPPWRISRHSGAASRVIWLENGKVHTFSNAQNQQPSPLRALTAPLIGARMVSGRRTPPSEHQTFARFGHAPGRSDHGKTPMAAPGSGIPDQPPAMVRVKASGMNRCPNGAIHHFCPCPRRVQAEPFRRPSHRPPRHREALSRRSVPDPLRPGHSRLRPGARPLDPANPQGPKYARSRLRQSR